MFVELLKLVEFVKSIMFHFACSTILLLASSLQGFQVLLELLTGELED